MPTMDRSSLVDLGGFIGASGTVTGPAVGGMWRFKMATLLVQVNQVSGLLPTLDFYLDSRIDGSSWINLVHLGPVTATGQWAAMLTREHNEHTLVGDVSSDAGRGTIRPMCWGDEVRYRAAVSGAGSGSASFSGQVLFIGQF